MPFWNVNLWRRIPVADRVNLGLGGNSGQPHREQAQKRQSGHDMAHWKILKGAKSFSTHGHDTTKILAVSLSGASGKSVARCSLIPWHSCVKTTIGWID
jgi:hypothetical protein